jgi:hypothetical protein
MNLSQFKDDDGVTVAWRYFHDEATRQQAVRELLPLADNKEIRWHDVNAVRCQEDPFGEKNCLGFVVLIDQTEQLAACAVQLRERAATAENLEELLNVARMMRLGVYPCNIPDFANILAEARRIFEARFTIFGRLTLTYPRAIVTYDFDTLLIDREGLKFTRGGMVQSHSTEDLAEVINIAIKPRREAT